MSEPENPLPPPAEGATPPEAPLSLPPPPVIAQANFPEDIRTPWGWTDLVIFVVVGFASLIILNNLLALVVMVWLGVKPDEIVGYATTNAEFISLRQALWYAGLMFYLFGFIRLRHRQPFWRAVGWRRLRLSAVTPPAVYLMCLLGGVVLAVSIELASMFFRTSATLPIEALFHERRSVLWLMAIGILLAPLVEETIFRGYLYPVLARTFGVEGGVLSTGVLFGLMHAPQLWGGWGQIVLLIVVGVVLTYARARSGTVLTSFFLHLGYNSFLFAGFYFYTGGLRHFPPGM